MGGPDRTVGYSGNRVGPAAESTNRGHLATTGNQLRETSEGKKVTKIKPLLNMQMGFGTKEGKWGGGKSQDREVGVKRRGQK